MDLHPISTPPTEAERAAVAAALGSELGPPVGLAEAEGRRHLLLPVLHALQARVGWISPGGLGEACRRLGIPPAEAYGVASFYALFSLTERPARVVHVCDDVACKALGADAVVEALQGDARVLRSPCLGRCEAGPVALLQQAGEAPEEAQWTGVDAASVKAVAEGAAPPALAPATLNQDRAGLRLLRRVGLVDPDRLESYRAAGGYRALPAAFALGARGVIAAVSQARLMGRGGAAFPTGRKWATVADQAETVRYVVCNADESEPGTFKDRVIMEEDPFSLVEAMTIAGFAVGAAKGFLYVRAEYPLATARVRAAVEQARAAGLLGENILGSGFSFEIELRRGAGAYICGEETALFNSLEGFRGEPRSKPPFPVQVGLFGKPTLVNNVETLVNVPDIVLEGGEAFTNIGTSGSTGTRLFCLSGNVARPGIYEAPFGVTLGELLAMAGGVAGGRPLQAILLGGAAGTFVGPADLELKLTFEDTRKAGATLGSGVVVVLDDRQSMMGQLQRIAAFFRDESCGQCVPCRVGTVRQQELLSRLARGRPKGGIAQEKALLSELGQCMRDASICGLGQTASSAIESAINRLGVLEGA